MANLNLLKTKVPTCTGRHFSGKAKLKVFPVQPNASRFDNVADESPREAEGANAPQNETPPYDFSKSVRYKVCQERVPVHKILHTTPTSFEQVRAAINLQSLQPALLPQYYAKSSDKG